MDLDRVIKIEADAKQSIYSIYSSAKYFKLTSDEIHARVLKVKEDMPKKTPRYVRSFVDGMVEVLNSDLHANHLEFCYTIDDKLYSIVKKSSRYYENYFAPYELHKRHTKSGFYWIDTDKEYFIGTNKK